MKKKKKEYISESIHIFLISFSSLKRFLSKSFAWGARCGTMVREETIHHVVSEEGIEAGRSSPMLYLQQTHPEQWRGHPQGGQSLL